MTITVFLLSGCTTSVPPSLPPAHATATPNVIQTLEQRPLHLPSLIPGSPCPRTPGHIVAPGYAAALGDGPLYPVGLGTDGILHYEDAHHFGDGRSDWGGEKVGWLFGPTYTGKALIRGHQLDGPRELRFGTSEALPSPELVLTGGSVSSGWYGVPSYTRLQSPGCYAYQVDGLSFSYVIIFQAVPQASHAVS